MTIEERIEQRFGELSPQERRAATVILENREDLAVYSSAELARMSGVSRATLSRLYRHLGFSSFQEVRDEARAMRSRRGAPIGGEGPVGHADHLDVEIRNLQRCFEQLADGRLDRAAHSIARARDLLIVGKRNSYPVAQHLRQQLAQLRPGVRLLPGPGQTLAEDLAGLGAGDTVVLIGFRRRTDDFLTLLDVCTASGAEVVLVADGSMRPHAKWATISLECPIDSAGAFMSLASAMSVMSLLANQVSAVIGAAGQRRVAQVQRTYGQLAELDVS